MIALLLLGQIPAPLPGLDAPKASLEEPRREIVAEKVPDIRDAVAWAVQDIMLLSPIDRRYTRYLWIPPWGDVTWHQANSWIVNSAISHSSTILLPEGVAGGWMIRWDLRRLAPKDHDLANLLIVWNALGTNEPYFHIELPKDQYSATKPWTYIDGKTYNGRRFIPAPLVSEGYSLLERETDSFAPLLRADDFLRRVSSTIEGGMYYHFIGFIRGGKRLTEKDIFDTVGLNVVLSRKVEGDDRAAVFQSAVTSKPRMVEQVQGAVGKARITYDLFDEDVEANRHPIYELLDFVNRARGKEIIYERANGLFGYVLTDGNGNLVDVAPPNLVSDSEVPDPVTKQLYPMISCIRCHGPTRGVQEVRNDVSALLGGPQGDIDIFDDLSSKENRFATVDRLVGLYAAGDKFKDELDRSRFKFADASWEATRGMGVREKEDIATRTATIISKQFADYWYPVTKVEGNINPDKACLELGYRVKPGEGVEFLKTNLKPNRIDVLIEGKPIQFGDPAIAALRRGLSIRRQDFQRVYSIMAYELYSGRK